MPRRQRRAERTAGITGGGLNPDVFKNLLRKMIPFATQLSATPPARQRFFWPVTSRAWRANRTMISSVTNWIERATSM